MEDRIRKVITRLAIGPWFELFLGLPGVLLFRNEASTVQIASYVLLVPFAVGG